MSSASDASIARLLEETEAAHGEYETTVLGGARDKQWPDWYAAYLIDHGLLDLIPNTRRLGAAELATTLTGLDARYRREQPAIPWPRYYAERLAAPDG